MQELNGRSLRMSDYDDADYAERLECDNEALQAEVDDLKAKLAESIENHEHFADLHKEAHNIIIPELKAKYDELLSYLPKVPTQPYEKELAQKLELEQRVNKVLVEALEKIVPEPPGCDSSWYAKQALTEAEKLREE
mgnify:CR=1 FL=1